MQFSRECDGAEAFDGLPNGGPGRYTDGMKRVGRDLERTMLPSRRRAAVGLVLGIAALATGVGADALIAQTSQSQKPSQTAGRVELLMFDDVGCPWCAKWRAEVGPGYANSPEGRRAPLRTIGLRNGVPAGVALASSVRATPTFVLVQDGREVGRITGYPGPDFFWSMLGDLMAKLRDDQPGVAIVPI